VLLRGLAKKWPKVWLRDNARKFLHLILLNNLKIFAHVPDCLLNVLWQTGVELELVESLPLLEWLANNYKSFGATLEIITDKSQEGAQFVRGFGGIGGYNL